MEIICVVIQVAYSCCMSVASQLLINGHVHGDRNAYTAVRSPYGTLGK